MKQEFITLFKAVKKLLTDTVFKISGKVDVKFPQVQKVELTNPTEAKDSISVNNLKEVNDEISKLKEGVVNKLDSLNTEVDLTEVVKAIKNIPKVEIPEQIDFSKNIVKELQSLSKAFSSKNEDVNIDITNSLKELINAIEQEFEYRSFKDTLKVTLREDQIEKIGQGISVAVSGGGGIEGASTEAKQDSIVTELQDIETDIEATNTKLDGITENQTDGTQKTQLVDNNINSISSSNPLSTRDFDIDIGLGRITGYKVIHKYGRNANVGASEAPITGGAILNWLTTATTVRVKAGGNAADAAAGAGARKVLVIGLDENFAEAEEEITLNANGTLASAATTTTFIRVFRAYVTETGTYTGTNTGNITIENSAGGTDLIQIQAGEGQTEFGAYTIPAGKTGHLASIYSTVDASKNGSVKMWTRNNADDVTAPYSAKRLKLFFDGIVGGNLFKTRIPLDGNVLTEKTDIWFTAISDATGASISVDFEILLVDN